MKNEAQDLLAQPNKKNQLDNMLMIGAAALYSLTNPIDFAVMASTALTAFASGDLFNTVEKDALTATALLFSSTLPAAYVAYKIADKYLGEKFTTTNALYATGVVAALTLPFSFTAVCALAPIGLCVTAAKAAKGYLDDKTSNVYQQGAKMCNSAKSCLVKETVSSVAAAAA